MPTIDPFWRFIIGVVVTLAIGVSQGTVALTHAIPSEAIPAVTAWFGIIAFVGSSVQTGLSAVGMSQSNRIASAAVIPEVKAIIATPAVADAAPSEKVVSTLPKV